MDASRRGFLKKGTVGALGVALSLGSTDKILGRAGSSSATPRLPLDKAAFQAQLKTPFFIGVSRVPITLFEVFDLGSKRTANGSREAFSLTFRGDNASPLRQETYRIDHEKLGRFSLLLVPTVSKEKSCRYYEAVINRLHG
jgi:hypothetical protein